tara:strand:+ start:50 stop:385 length:336 start_codon:yes stop_codon:yes gene_type:complete
MDLRQTFTEALNETKNGFLYTFDSNFVLDLMNLDLFKSIDMVRQIEKYVDNAYVTAPDETFELCGVIKGSNPFYFLIVIDNINHMIFEYMVEIDSDTYLDYYNKNMVINKP